MPNKNNEIRSKLALLQLADELKSISKACSIMGYSRDSYYRFKKQYETAGERGLINLSRKKPAIKNRVSAEVEEQVIEIALDYPNYGQAKVSELLTTRGCKISASGVRTIWLRHNLETKKNRLIALHTKLKQEENWSPTEQDHLEQLYKVTTGNPIVECLFPGDICVQDTYDLGNISPLGHLYQHTFIEGYTQFAHAIVLPTADSITAIQFLYKQVLPWYEQNSIRINSILTDRGAEFSGKKNQTFSEELAKLGIKHIKMRAYNGPLVNGLAARFQKLSYYDFFEVYLKKNKVKSLDELNYQLQLWCNSYNHNHSISGRYSLGKNPVEVLKVSKHLIEN